jgi:hypothetical protein
VPEATVAEEAAGAVFLLLGKGGDLVADLLEALDPFGSVGEAEVDPAVADPGLQLLGSDRLGLRVGGDDDLDAAEDLSGVEEDGDAHGDDIVGDLGVLADEAVEGVADGFGGGGPDGRHVRVGEAEEMGLEEELGVALSKGWHLLSQDLAL